MLLTTYSPSLPSLPPRPRHGSTFFSIRTTPLSSHLPKFVPLHSLPDTLPCQLLTFWTQRGPDPTAGLTWHFRLSGKIALYIEPLLTQTHIWIPMENFLVPFFSPITTRIPFICIFHAQDLSTRCWSVTGHTILITALNPSILKKVYLYINQTHI